MLKITEEEIKKILPSKGPSFEEVKNYLEKYNDEYIVIKCGGSVLVDQSLFNHFINDISVLNKLGFIPIIIHGGGKRISIKLNEEGIKSNFINGLRVTDEKSIKIVEEVLNNFNEEITKALKKNNCDSQGITNKKNNILLIEQENQELGLVYNIGIDEKNNVLITMTLTTPNCPEAETIPDRVAEAVSKCNNVGDVRVEIVWEPTWTQDNMSEAARLELGFF